MVNKMTKTEKNRLLFLLKKFEKENRTKIPFYDNAKIMEVIKIVGRR